MSEDPRDSDDVDLTDSRFYLNRELSELAFQRRVLHEAEDGRNPLLERVRFLAILTQNIDEFFMKRIGGLKLQIEAGVTDQTPDGRRPAEQWDEAIATARDLLDRQATVYHELHEALDSVGIRILDHEKLTDDQQSSIREFFEESVLPTLTPLTFDPAHPFPFISNLSLSLAVLTRESPGEELTFSRVKVPGNRTRLVSVGDEDGYVLLEDVIGANLDLLFPTVEVVDWAPFRVTRNAEVRRNEEVAEDLVNRIREVLHQRQFATVVRLEVDEDMHEDAKSVLINQLDLEAEEIFELAGPLDYRPFTALFELDRPELKPEPWTPQPHPELPDEENGDIFGAIRSDDQLIHHPYHSFASTVQRFLDQAAEDPDVLAIKAAIYRTARDSKVIESLIRAARNGKQVAVMVELKARFDEENNLRWVERLEAEGIHVAYGTLGLKTHTKTTLVVREEGDDVRLYSHVATGNYHSETAKQYEDMGLLTADPDIGYDLVKLFNFFTGHALHEEYRKLLIAPTNMRDRFENLIRREAQHARDGLDARIVAKVNRLEDLELVAELYRASRAGVKIDLIVRDICRLRPGLEGVSETIAVRSIVGQFLEHSRVFRFENDGDPDYFIGSADWMTRNLDNRVEAVVPIEDSRLQSRIDTVLETMLLDNRRAWELQSDGTYEQCLPDEDETIDSQERLKASARRAVPDEPNDVDSNGPESVAVETPVRPFPDAGLSDRIRHQLDAGEITDEE